MGAGPLRRRSSSARLFWKTRPESRCGGERRPRRHDSQSTPTTTRQEHESTQGATGKDSGLDENGGTLDRGRVSECRRPTSPLQMMLIWNYTQTSTVDSPKRCRGVAATIILEFLNSRVLGYLGTWVPTQLLQSKRYPLHRHTAVADDHENVLKGPNVLERITFDNDEISLQAHLDLSRLFSHRICHSFGTSSNASTTHDLERGRSAE